MIGDKILNASYSNIPLINLRWEFRDNYNILKDPCFRCCFKPPLKPIQIPQLIWLGMPNDLLTLLLQRGILGIEAYIPGAVFHCLGYLGKLKENMKYIKNPFEIQGARGTASKYYHQLPSLVDSSFSLQSYDQQLWDLTCRFYKQVRNPIFHGKQITQGGPEAVLDAYELLAELYKWIDHWFSPENL